MAVKSVSSFQNRIGEHRKTDNLNEVKTPDLREFFIYFRELNRESIFPV